MMMFFEQDEMEFSIRRELGKACEEIKNIFKESFKTDLPRLEDVNHTMELGHELELQFHYRGSTKEEAIQAGKKFAEGKGIKDAIVIPYGYSTRWGVGNTTDSSNALIPDCYYAYKLQIPKSEFYDLAKRIGAWEEIQPILNKGNENLAVINLTLERACDVLALPIGSIEINRKKNYAQINFAKIYEKEEDLDVRFKMKRFLHKEFHAQLGLSYGFNPEKMGFQDGSGARSISFWNFRLGGKENIDRLIQLIKPDLPEPEIEQKMTEESWEELLNKKRDQFLQENPKPRDRFWEFHESHQDYLKKERERKNNNSNKKQESSLSESSPPENTQSPANNPTPTELPDRATEEEKSSKMPKREDFDDFWAFHDAHQAFLDQSR